MKLLFIFLNQAKGPQGWNGLGLITPKLRIYLSWQPSKVRENKQQTFEVIPYQVLIVTEASRRGWGATLQLNNNEIEFKSCGIWKKSSVLKSSNQRGLTDVLCAICRFEKHLKQEQIHQVHLQMDNTTTSYNINRANSSRTLSHITDTILRTMKQFKIQIKSTHIPGIFNKIADSLSRLNRAGDYNLSGKTASRACKWMKFRPTIDIFESSRNRPTKEYCIIIQDRQAEARNAFSISWAREQPIIHPLIALIGRCPKRVQHERIQALIITPKWQGQYWWPLLQQMTVSSVNQGHADQILKNGTIANKRAWALLLGELLTSLISGRKEEKNEKACQKKQ
ncbi:MAG: hypothetical protein EZS28_001150 [Streblomastix strix]|uniref:RNase H type-1 domain-containing protein n=1 Tax=Streblomastix strix TaxID=222440 RepID=A0A5J4X7V9_9EUKA|nr:MAG: hypothetical protein EZS28_001150 [Streblomastix strix]